MKNDENTRRLTNLVERVLGIASGHGLRRSEVHKVEPAMRELQRLGFVAVVFDGHKELFTPTSAGLAWLAAPHHAAHC